MMKIVRYSPKGAQPGSEKAPGRYGTLDGELIRDIDGDPFGEIRYTGVSLALEDAQLLVPVERPRIFAVGMNYKGHIAEAGATTPEFPLMFMMPDTALAAHLQAVILPREATVVHHECELAIVIGKRGRRITEADAPAHILGYTCANDVSERTIQKSEMALGSLLIGKSFDTFCPLGPLIATDVDPHNLSIGTRVNGRQRQLGNTGDMLFSVEYIVSYLSQAITLLPGDVILTGTPSGVDLLQAGDRCEISISGIGTLINDIVGES
jgi:2-keto-4-pentenoate hydratase/2-oxohepta-3-ene-1,7-dioic acid hydratase in catechol pathway